MEIKKENTEQTDKIWDGSFLFVCWTYFIILLMFASLRVISGLGWLDNLDRRVVEVGFSIASQIIIMAAVPLVAMFIYKRRLEKKKNQTTLTDNKKTSLFASFGFDKPSARTIGFAILLGLLIYFFNIFVASFFNGILNMLGFRFMMGMGETPFGGVWGLVIGLALIAVLPGVCEEVSHRGMLLKSFSARMGIMRAMFWTSIMFGFMHLNVVQVFYAAILGYIIALATVATRSLWVGIIMHFMNNGIGTYLSLAYRYNWFGGDMLYHMMNLFAGAGIILYIAFVVFLYWSIMHIIHVLAKMGYQKNRIRSLANIIAEYPNILVKPDGVIATFDEFAVQVDQNLERVSKWQRTKFYLDPMSAMVRKPMKLTVKEKTIFYGIIFMGALLTIFTAVWGFL
ncbi:MAG: CPBP family intramembrane metalloprotease [Firmicutes bacterium]|nr:CPBP family intramembrane metalloprotease [Bacillota bacterium]